MPFSHVSPDREIANGIIWKHRKIIHEIIIQLKKGVKPWRKPWSDATNTVVVGSMSYSANLWPSNLRAPAVPFGTYNGVILLTQAALKKYRTNFWITAKTFQQLKLTLIDVGQQPTIIRAYYSNSPSLYNIDQIKNCEKTLGLSFKERTQGASETLRYKKSKKLLEIIIKRRALSIVGGNRAAYSPVEDRITMPEIEQFNDQVGPYDGEAHYWATLWHEVVHWTGHKDRLCRDFTGRFGDTSYAFEELIAELGTTFLCAHLGINGELQHASYIESWLRILNDCHEKLFEACRFADQAKKFILDGCAEIWKRKPLLR